MQMCFGYLNSVVVTNISLFVSAAVALQDILAKVDLYKNRPASQNESGLVP